MSAQQLAESPALRGFGTGWLDLKQEFSGTVHSCPFPGLSRLRKDRKGKERGAEGALFTL